MRGGIATLLGLGALGAGLIVPAASLGYRFEVFDLGAAMGLLRGSAPYLTGGAAAGALALLIALIPRPNGAALLAILGIGACGAGLYTLNAMRQAFEAHPFIHDVTTDLDDPPAFSAAIADQRGPGDHPIAFAAYVTERDAVALHREGYPDLRPVMMAAGPAEAFPRALAAAEGMGWAIATAQAETGRIEATDTTFWFGFKDDVVVRLRATPSGGTQVDVRSQSRVGGSDLGTNAKRVRAYLDALQAAGG